MSAAGRAVSVDRLVEAMWHDEPPDAARHTVKTYVSRLRTVLGDTCVLNDGGGYRLDLAEATVDAAEFERLVDRARHAPSTQSVALLDEAVGLWRGDAYGEFASEWWALPEASRLEELRLVALRAPQRGADPDRRARPRRHRPRAAGAHLPAAQPVRRTARRGVRPHRPAGRGVARPPSSTATTSPRRPGCRCSPRLVELERSIVGGGGEAAASGQALRGYVLGEVIGSSRRASGVATVYRSVQPGTRSRRRCQGDHGRPSPTHRSSSTVSSSTPSASPASSTRTSCRSTTSGGNPAVPTSSCA